MKVRFKMTIWEEIEVNDSVADKVVDKIESGEIFCSQQLEDDEEIGPHTGLREQVDFSGEYMTVDQNKGEATILIIEGEEGSEDVTYNNGVDSQLTKLD